MAIAASTRFQPTVRYSRRSARPTATVRFVSSVPLGCSRAITYALSERDLSVSGPEHL